MNYTTLEQSKKLVELGLNSNTADMKWYYWKDEIDAPKIPTLGFDKAALESYKNTQAVYLPCWSLGVLLELIPNYMVYHIGNNKTHITFYSAPRITPRPTYITNDYDSIIDAAFQMVCWLLKNSYIKKGE